MIDTDVLPLMDVATESRGAGEAGAPATNGSDDPAADQGREGPRAVRARLRRTSSTGSRSARSTRAADRDRHGDVHAARSAPASSSASRKCSTRSAAAAWCRSAPTWSGRASSSTAAFIFIDGRTGTTLHSENFREEILYNANQTTPALSSYFELMDRLIPSFLSTLSSQKIKGTRVLLQ